jgi:hypothetical protein
MKKLLTFCSICITASMLFSSCASNFSIMKRHYTNGYYVDYTGNNKTITSKTEDKVAQPATETKVNEPQYSEKQDQVSASPVSSNNDKTPSLLANEKKALSKINSHLANKQVLANKPGAVEGSFAENNKAVSESPKVVTGVADHDDGARAALSLFWLIIVIILILWLIGILAGGFGLGGLINLLLVVALILLILWLLRIV